MADREVTVSDLSDLTGLTRAGIYRILAGNRPHQTTITALAAALRVTRERIERALRAGREAVS